ncbi:DNA primase family protein [Chitinophaga arvensicola]|uniref:Putative DNA primase/helicase n=1 Tax=Chitinophaga arvensicola TaxID=29529 RepID=A0A1I0QIV2_9BACT|nr:phage/plasmid primase, P4 family [Chitinophaga arvensicola]SEW27116.1 putative DNA primase/helicase [Chitinophaga arvensicola]
MEQDNLALNTGCLSNIDFSEQDQLFVSNKLTPVGILDHSKELLKSGEALPHAQVLNNLLQKIEPVDFQLQAFPGVANLRIDLMTIEQQLVNKDGTFKDDPAIREKIKLIQTQIDKSRPKQPQYLIICIEEILRLAKANNWGICRNHDFIYLYNGAYWSALDMEELKSFLGTGAEVMGLDKYKGRFYIFRDHLYKQFLALANLPKPAPPANTVLVNLLNGTFEIVPDGTRLRHFKREDFITYQLPFAYDSTADAPLFIRYLNTVLPDIQRQNVLAEFMGYVFIHPDTLKLEKALLLYGTGANGKSVFFEVINALLGSENVCSYSLQSLTDNTGYYRAKLANKLVNYASEINGNLEASIFKQLASGEPVEARQPYGQAFNLVHYAKLIFNCNELPRDVEHTNAYFRRFLIIPFDVTIPEAEQDKELSKKIIANELSGVFNWILEGLHRLLVQKRFSDCDAARQQVEQYKKQSDSVLIFLEDEEYQISIIGSKPLKDLFSEYRMYCSDSGYRPCSTKTFSERLKQYGFTLERKARGMIIYIEK